MIKKFIIFGSCNSAGVELYSDTKIPNYADMDPIMAAVRSDFLVYADHVQNKKHNENISHQIEFETKNSWVKQLSKHFPEAEIINVSVAQSNLKNFLKAATYLYQNDVDKDSTYIIVEMTEPTGLTLCQDDVLKSYGKPHLEFFLGSDEQKFMEGYLDKYENDRYRAYLDIISLYNLIGNLKYQGFNANYFIWDRQFWQDLIVETTPIKMFMPYSDGTDALNSMFYDFFEGSLLTSQQEQELKKIKLYPQGHYVPVAHELLGNYIATKIKETL